MKVQQKKTDALQLAQVNAEATQKSALKTELRGMGYEDGVRRLTPKDDARSPAPAASENDPFDSLRRAYLALGRLAGQLQTELAALRWKGGRVHPKDMPLAHAALQRFNDAARAAVDGATPTFNEDDLRRFPVCREVVAHFATLAAAVRQGLAPEDLASPRHTSAVVLAIIGETPADTRAYFEQGCSQIAPLPEDRTKAEALEEKVGPGKKGAGRIDMRQ